MPVQLFHNFCHFSYINFVARGSSSEADGQVFVSSVQTLLGCGSADVLAYASRQATDEGQIWKDFHSSLV